MNNQEAIKIIRNNANSENESLLDYTHERETFNETAFWDFYNAIRQLGFDYSNESELNRELTANLIKSYEYFLLQIGFHFDKRNVYVMKGLPANFTIYCERLRTAIDAFLIGKPISDKTEGYLNEDLKNILIKNYGK